ncbi:hypothetical protein CsatB_029716 [Cannabis sativa]
MGELSCELPDELMRKILVKVPAESLVRFKWVSKSWHGFITDPSFAYNHLVHHNNDTVLSSTSILLSWFSVDFARHNKIKPILSLFSNPEAVYPTDFLNLFHSITDFFDHLPRTYYWDEMYDYYRTYHCNGIICIAQNYMDKGKSVLINPVIRETRILPESTIPLRHILKTHGEGFGYDLNANDFKLVRIFGRNRNFKCFAELYSMNSDSWKRIKIDVKLDDTCFHHGKGVLCKGVFYWLMMLLTPFPDFEYQTILSFDMSNEEFHSMPLPVDAMRNGDFMFDKREKCLVEWNKSVALLVVDEYKENLPCYIQMFVMDDYNGGEYSWTTHPTIGPLETYHFPLIFSSTDELIMVNSDKGVVSYNLKTQTLRGLPLPEVDMGTCLSNFYVKSLISVEKRD